MPPGANTCSRDGAQLSQRDDDKEDVVANRLEVYQTQTRPLIDHYSKLGLLRVVAGEGALEEVFERMEAAALAKAVPAGKVQVTTGKARSAAKSTSAGKKNAKSKNKKKAVTRKSAKARRKPVRKAARKPTRKAATRTVRRKSAKRAVKRKTARTRRATKARRR
jgi:adenylate kinase